MCIIEDTKKRMDYEFQDAKETKKYENKNSFSSLFVFLFILPKVMFSVYAFIPSYINPTQTVESNPYKINEVKKETFYWSPVIQSSI